MFKGIQIYHGCFDTTNNIQDSTFDDNLAAWIMSYLALTLATTLWCTILILYCIISVARSSHGAGIYSYQRVIEALIESAALCSVILVIDIVFVACNILSGNYIGTLGGTIRVCLLQY